MSDQADRESVGKGNGRDGRGRFQPGCPPGPGRPPGTPNAISGQIKQDILSSYEERGGRKWLDTLPDGAFVGLLKAVLPKEGRVEIEPNPAVQFTQINVAGVREAYEALAETDRRRYHPDLPPMAEVFGPLPMPKELMEAEGQVDGGGLPDATGE